MHTPRSTIEKYVRLICLPSSSDGSIQLQLEPLLFLCGFSSLVQKIIFKYRKGLIFFLPGKSQPIIASAHKYHKRINQICLWHPLVGNKQTPFTKKKRNTSNEWFALFLSKHCQYHRYLGKKRKTNQPTKPKLSQKETYWLLPVLFIVQLFQERKFPTTYFAIFFETIISPIFFREKEIKPFSQCNMKS